MKRIAAVSVLLAVACGGMAVDSLPDGGVDGTHSAFAEEPELGQLEQAWCIGCAAGVSVPTNLEKGYGLRPINETIAGRSYQFPACQGTETSMPHACRFPIGNKFYFGAPPSAWGSGRKASYRAAVDKITAELGNAGKTWASAHIHGADPWDGVDAQGIDQRYRHTEVLVKNEITNSPHPLFRLTLQGINNTASGNLKGYLACEIEFDFSGPLGIANNGGHCTGHCLDAGSPEVYGAARQNAFHRALSRCVGLGGDQLPIYEWNVGQSGNACFAYDGFSCASGGGDGLLRKEWLPAGWWSQKFMKNCQGNNPQTPCDGIWQAPMGSGQFLSGAALLWNFTH